MEATESQMWKEAALEAARVFQGGPDAPKDNSRFWRLMELLGVDPWNLPERTDLPALEMPNG